MGEVQTVWCEDAIVKVIVVCYKDLSNNWLLIVIVYAKGVNTWIINKAIVVVYIKLLTMAHRIRRIIKNFN